MRNIFKIREKCRICENELTPILALGHTPLADRFVEDPKIIEPTAPLNVSYCAQCHLVQLVDIVFDEVLFSSDYAFYTGASPSSLPYFKKYADITLEYYPEQSKGLIVEVASNDGTLLKHFKNKGLRVLGVDPTSNTAQVAIDNGIETLVKSFGNTVAEEIVEEFGKASMVIGNNVLAHVDDLHDFVNGVAKLLAEDGVAMFEVQYFPHLIFNTAYDHVYHEHRSFFSLTPLQTLFSMHKMRITDVWEADTQGGSIRIFVTHESQHKPIHYRVARLLDMETKLGITSPNLYKSMQNYVDYNRTKLVTMLLDLKKDRNIIYGYGASAKGNTLLNYCRIGEDILDVIVDKTPYKIGKYSPGMHIPVVGDDHDLPRPDYYLVLVWNYLPGIFEREKEFRDKGGKFIVPIPSPVIL